MQNRKGKKVGGTGRADYGLSNENRNRTKRREGGIENWRPANCGGGVCSENAKCHIKNATRRETSVGIEKRNWGG